MKGLRAQIPLAESGRQRIGENHANAKLSDQDVEAIRDAYEAHPPGHPEHVGYRKLATVWGLPKRTVRAIVNYERRNHWAGRWKG